MMLATRYKLKERAEIDRALSEGVIFQSEGFGVAAYKTDVQEYPKFAFVISTKISKLAVHRNRINRALNEAVRRNMPKIPKGYDFVFLVKRAIATKTTEEIMREIETFFSREKYT